MTESGPGEKKGFWGSTLSKLRSALSRTREAVVESIVDEAPAAPAQP